MAATNAKHMQGVRWHCTSMPLSQAIFFGKHDDSSLLGTMVHSGLNGLRFLARAMFLRTSWGRLLPLNDAARLAHDQKLCILPDRPMTMRFFCWDLRAVLSRYAKLSGAESASENAGAGARSLATASSSCDLKTRVPCWGSYNHIVRHPYIVEYGILTRSRKTGRATHDPVLERLPPFSARLGLRGIPR